VDSLGSRLKRAREERGTTLKEISLSTKISVGVLEALERDEFSRLPGGIFSRALVRAYAKAIGLDPEAVVQDFLAEVDRIEHRALAARAASAAAEKTASNLSADDQRRRISRLVLAGVLTVVVALTAWGISTWVRERPPATDTAVQSQTPPAPTPPAPATDAPVPAPAPPAVPAAVRSATLTVDFEVTAKCWVRVVADGRAQFVATMSPGERQSIPADCELQITVGNTGAFVWRLNGRPAQVLGKPGGVRTVRVTSENYSTFLQ